MKSSPEGLILAGAVALIVILFSQFDGAQLAPDYLQASTTAAGKENKRDPRRRLIPLHERPERPMLACTTSESGALPRHIEPRLG